MVADKHGTGSLMAKDADFWEAMYRAVIRRLGEITNSDDDHRILQGDE